MGGLLSVHNDGRFPADWTENAQPSKTKSKVWLETNGIYVFKGRLLNPHTGRSESWKPRGSHADSGAPWWRMCVFCLLPKCLPLCQKANILKPNGVNAYYTPSSFVAEGTYYNPTPHAKLPIYDNIPCLENKTIQTL